MPRSNLPEINRTMETLKYDAARLSDVIKLSSFRIGTDRFVYTRVAHVLPGVSHLMVIDDGEEITVVTREENLSLIGAYTANKDRWRLINVKCGNPFYCVGFIAGITGALAKEGIDVVLASSYTKDLVLVVEDDLEKAVEVLKGEGFVEE
jgi:hypothetical protein